MHELSIALSVLDVAQEEADRRGVQVQAIHLKLGLLSGVVKEALLSAYDLARENTPLESCRLIIEEIPILAYCENCKAQRAIHSMQSFSCCECEAPVSEIVQGRELQVFALEISP
jgi:hydrogenase nickel incorporation protein HypA/HybF